MSCFPNFSYFSTSAFLTLSFHVITIISTPTYFLGFICILFKTPCQMRSVKWYMLVLQFWIAVFDYSVSFLVVPFMLIPEIAGIPNGILRDWGVPTSIQAVLMLMTFAYMGISIISVYENRFYILCQFRGKKLWTMRRRFWLPAHYLLILVLLAPVFPLIPDQETAKKQVFKNLPCLPDSIYNGHVFVLTTNYTYYLCSAIPTILFFFTETGFFAFQIIQNGLKQRCSKTISEKTYQLHRQFFVAFGIQLIIPLIMIIIPIIYVYTSIFTGYSNQAANNLSMMTASTHGFVSTVVMVVVHRPYRREILGMIGIRKKVIRSNVIVSMNS